MGFADSRTNINGRKMTKKWKNISRNLKKIVNIARLRSFALPHGFPRPRGEVLPQRILGIKKGYILGYIRWVYPSDIINERSVMQFSRGILLHFLFYHLFLDSLEFVARENEKRHAVEGQTYAPS